MQCCLHSINSYPTCLVLVIVHADHSTLNYLIAKTDAMSRLIRWVLLLQKFDFVIKDNMGKENLVSDHLSRLEDKALLKLGDMVEINDAFQDKHLLGASQDLIPRFANFANYFKSDLIP